MLIIMPTLRSERIRSRRPSYLERKLGKASFIAALRKSKTNVDLVKNEAVILSPGMPKSVSKQIRYHWKTLRKTNGGLRKNGDKDSNVSPLSASGISQKRNSSDSVISEKFLNKMKNTIKKSESLGSIRTITNFRDRSKSSTESINSELSRRIAYSRRCSRVSILDQAEAYHKPKDGIKKMVVTSIGRRASVMANWFTNKETDEKQSMIPKSASVSNGFCSSSRETEEESFDEGIGLNNSSYDSLPYIDDDLEQDLELFGAVGGQVHTSSSVYGMTGSSFGASGSRPISAYGSGGSSMSKSASITPLSIPSKALKASCSDLSNVGTVEPTPAQIRRELYATHQGRSREENIQSWRKISRKLVHAGKVIRKQEDQKNLRKMWRNSYAGMCNRAIVLDKVVNEASKQGMKIKPFVVTSLTTVDDLATVKNRKYIGLGRKFYGFRNVVEDEKYADLPSFVSLSQAQVDDTTGPGGVITLRWNDLDNFLKSFFKIS